MKKLFCLSLIIFVLISLIALTATATAETSLWDGTTTTQPTSIKALDGVYYYEISTAEELAYIAKTGGDWLGYNYILANDISLNSVKLTYDANGNLMVDDSTLNQWTPIDYFTGILNGDDHTISGIYVNTNSSAGFIRCGTGTISNLNLINSYIKGTYCVGGFFGSTDYITNSHTLENCFYDGVVVGTESVGGLVGYSDYLTIDNCGNYGSVYGTQNVGGIAGDSRWCFVSNTFNEGNVFATGINVGGLFSKSSHGGYASNCINKGNITGEKNVGGIFGYLDGGNLDVNNCSNFGDVRGNSYIGGIFGYCVVDSYGTPVAIQCYNVGKIGGFEYVGGIVGKFSLCNILECINIGVIEGSQSVGGIAGYSDTIWGKGIASRCVYMKTSTINSTLKGFGNINDVDGIVNAKDISFFCINSDKTLNIKGHVYSSNETCDAICDNCDYERTVEHTYDNIKYDSDKHWYECYCGGKKIDSESPHTGGTESCDVCDYENYPSLFSGGNGTKENPYIVSTATDVLNITNHLDCYFFQVGDISFQGVEHTPIGTYETPFTGNYNGNGFSIKNISFKSKDTQYSGLFGYSRGSISNVRLDNCLFDVSSNTVTVYCGAIAGYNFGTISSCVVDADIRSSTKGEGLSVYAGGISGYSTQILKNCLFDGEVTSTVSYIDSIAYSGGIVANGSAQDCANYGNISSIASVSSDAYAGGIVAITRNSIKNCYNAGNIVAKNADTAYAGGISGINESSIKSCNNDGSVYANTKYSYSETYSGGISGMNRSTISYCINTGKIDADSTSSHVRVGGIAGYNYSSIQDSKNYGAISGYATEYESHIGGIVGTSYRGSYVRRCCNNGKVITSDNGSYSLGSAGGIVGLLQYGTTLQCCNHGEVLGIQKADKLSCYVGGVVGGTSECTIIDCYNTGKVTMDYKGNKEWSAGACGGIYGESGSSCAYCYNVGELNVTYEYSEIGGIQGLGNSANANSLEYCYALKVYDDPYAIEMSDAESKIKETYVGFDFENVWAIAPSINDGRPYIATIPNEDNENWYSNNNVMVSLSSSSIKLGIGKEKTLSVISDLESEDVIWTTSNSDIVTVDGGVITAVAKGTAIITTSTLNETHIASCVVTVVDGNVFSISGKISSYGDNSNVKIELLETGDTTTINDSINYQIDGVFPGTYTVRVSRSNHCLREYEVVVSDSDVILDIELTLCGDLDNSERVTIDDAIYLAFHTFYSDRYQIPNGMNVDFNKDGDVTIDDAIYLAFYTFYPDRYPIN